MASRRRRQSSVPSSTPGGFYWPQDLHYGQTPEPLDASNGNPSDQQQNVDQPFSFEDRAIVDSWDVRNKLYGTKLKDELVPYDATMQQNAAALRTHRAWGGVDARQVPGMKDRYEKLDKKHRDFQNYIYAPMPVVDEEQMPFDPRDMPKFIEECHRRLDREACETVTIHGWPRKVIALYGMPFQPSQGVYQTDNSIHTRRGCMGFGTMEALKKGPFGESLLRELQDCGKDDTADPDAVKYESNLPFFARQWVARAEDPKKEDPENTDVGGFNIAVSYTPEMQNTIRALFPKAGFWKDDLYNTHMNHVDKGSTSELLIKDVDLSSYTGYGPNMTEEAMRERFVEMGLSNGVVVRGSKPMHPGNVSRDEEQRRLAEPKTGKGKYQYPELYPYLKKVCAEAFTTLVAAANGIHPPVFAMLIAKIPHEASNGKSSPLGVMLTLMERGMSTLARPLVGGFVNPPPDQLKWLKSNIDHRTILAKHVSNRLSDLLFRSSVLGFMSANIKEDKLITTLPYDIPSINYPLLRPSAEVAGEVCSFRWIPFDVMHIDCGDPQYACFIPRSVQEKEIDEYQLDEKPSMIFLMHRGSGWPEADETLIVQSTCLRLIMLFLTVLHAFCHSFVRNGDDEKYHRQVKELSALYDQLFVDIFGILMERGTETFGPICTQLFTEEAYDSLYSAVDNIRIKQTLRAETMKGWNTVANLNVLKKTRALYEGGLNRAETHGGLGGGVAGDGEGGGGGGDGGPGGGSDPKRNTVFESVWTGVARLVKMQMHRHWMAQARGGVGGPCPTQLYELLMRAGDKQAQPTSTFDVVFTMEVDGYGREQFEDVRNMLHDEWVLLVDHASEVGFTVVPSYSEDSPRTTSLRIVFTCPTRDMATDIQDTIRQWFQQSQEPNEGDSHMFYGLRLSEIAITDPVAIKPASTVDVVFTMEVDGYGREKFEDVRNMLHDEWVMLVDNASEVGFTAVPSYSEDSPQTTSLRIVFTCPTRDVATDIRDTIRQWFQQSQESNEEIWYSFKVSRLSEIVITDPLLEKLGTAGVQTMDTKELSLLKKHYVNEYDDVYRRDMLLMLVGFLGHGLTTISSVESKKVADVEVSGRVDDDGSSRGQHHHAHQDGSGGSGDTTAGQREFPQRDPEICLELPRYDPINGTDGYYVGITVPDGACFYDSVRNIRAHNNMHQGRVEDKHAIRLKALSWLSKAVTLTDFDDPDKKAAGHGNEHYRSQSPPSFDIAERHARTSIFWNIFNRLLLPTEEDDNNLHHKKMRRYMEERHPYLSYQNFYSQAGGANVARPSEWHAEGLMRVARAFVQVQKDPYAWAEGLDMAATAWALKSDLCLWIIGKDPFREKGHEMTTMQRYLGIGAVPKIRVKYSIAGAAADDSITLNTGEVIRVRLGNHYVPLLRNPREDWSMFANVSPFVPYDQSLDESGWGDHGWATLMAQTDEQWWERRPQPQNDTPMLSPIPLSSSTS